MFNTYAAAQQFVSFVMLAFEVQNYCPTTLAEGQAMLDQDALHRSEMRRIYAYEQAASSYPGYMLDYMNGRPCACQSCTDYRGFLAQQEVDAPDYWGDEDFLDQEQADLDLDLFLAFTEHEDAEQTYYGSPAWLALETK